MDKREESRCGGLKTGLREVIEWARKRSKSDGVGKIKSIRIRLGGGDDQVAY